MRLILTFIFVIASCFQALGWQVHGSGSKAVSSYGSVGPTTVSAYMVGRGSNTVYYSKATATAGAANFAHIPVTYFDNAATLEIGLWASDGTFITSIQYTNDTGNFINEEWINVELDSEIILTATDYHCGAISDDTSWGIGTYDDNLTNRGSVSGTIGELDDIESFSFLGTDTYNIVFNNSADDPS